MSLWKVLTARWGTGAGETDEVRIDASTNSLQTVDYPHHEIFKLGNYPPVFIKGLELQILSRLMLHQAVGS